jgi:hypothetical protein
VKAAKRKRKLTAADMPAHLRSFRVDDDRWGAVSVAVAYARGELGYTREREVAYIAVHDRWRQARTVWLNAHPGFDRLSLFAHLRGSPLAAPEMTAARFPEDDEDDDPESNNRVVRP